MLDKKEISVMKCIYQLCRKQGDSCIVSNGFVIESTPEKYKITESQVDAIFKQLEYDGYIECTKTERKGACVNVITLKNKGKAFQRELVQRRRELFNTILWRCIFAAMGAVVALIVSRLLSNVGI